jgi:hypothetical protein
MFIHVLVFYEQEADAAFHCAQLEHNPGYKEPSIFPVI